MDGSTRDAERSAAELHLAQELGSLGLRRMHPLTIFPPPSENQMEPSNQMRSMQEKVLLFKGIIKDGVVILPPYFVGMPDFLQGENLDSGAIWSGGCSSGEPFPFVLFIPLPQGWGVGAVTGGPCAPNASASPSPSSHTGNGASWNTPLGRSAVSRVLRPAVFFGAALGAIALRGWAGALPLSRRGTGSGGPGSGRHSGGPEPGADGRGWAGVMEAQRPTAPSDG